MWSTNGRDKDKSIQQVRNIAYVLIGGCVGASNELKGEKQAVVQRCLTVLSQRGGDDIAQFIAPLLPVCLRTAAPQGTRRPVCGPALPARRRPLAADCACGVSPTLW